MSNPHQTVDINLRNQQSTLETPQGSDQYVPSHIEYGFDSLLVASNAAYKANEESAADEIVLLNRYILIEKRNTSMDFISCRHDNRS